tara:strand:- start:746 stop:1147 length:402 start_codon:yes stop_codon:yes gene_type:complete
MGLPQFLYNPFTDESPLYRTSEVFEKVSANTLQLVMFKDIHFGTQYKQEEFAPISKNRILGADIRYPPIIYKATKEKYKPKYCVYDGRHRLHRLQQEGKTSTVCFILKPTIFEKIRSIPNPYYQGNLCIGCGE